jgi:glycolate oxidase subunit GlcD
MGVPMAIDPALTKRLRALLGDAGVIADAARRLAYESDGLSLERGVAELVLLPGSTREAAGAMALLADAGVPVVARGAGTGLAGGATPVPGGVVVGTARMRRVLQVDAVDRWARVQAGVVNVDLTRACAHAGLFYAPDPSSQAACTIGGNVANNSGGPHCFRYGSTGRHVLGLTVVTAGGEVIELGGPGPEEQDLDLVGLFVGSEGMLGLATEVIVRLVREPEVVETLLAVFTDLDACCDAVSDMIAARLEPSAIEILDKLTIEAVEASVLRAGYPRDAEAVLLLEVDGGREEAEATVRDVLAIVEARGAIEVRRARDELERKKLWAGRKGAFGAMGRIAPDLYVADVVAPRTRLREIVRYATEVARERGLKLSNVFHAGDGNLHPNISYDRRNPDEVRRVLEAGELVMRRCVDLGGALTGEHGVGLEKREQMCLVYGNDDLDEMTRARRALDPTGRLNPTKLIPVRGCREIRTRPIGAHDATGHQAAGHDIDGAHRP